MRTPPPCCKLTPTEADSRKRRCARSLPFACSLGTSADNSRAESAIANILAPDGSRRTLAIECWSRSEECLERKWDHMDMIDDTYPSREAHILATTLKDKHTALEPNMFPYDTPTGIEHWTLWSQDEMDDGEVESYVNTWVMENASHVLSWNFDENSSRSINLFHVHVYFQVSIERSALRGC